MAFSNTHMISSRLQQFNQIAQQIQALTNELQSMVNQIPVSNLNTVQSGFQGNVLGNVQSGYQTGGYQTGGYTQTYPTQVITTPNTYMARN